MTTEENCHVSCSGLFADVHVEDKERNIFSGALSDALFEYGEYKRNTSRIIKFYENDLPIGRTANQLMPQGTIPI